MSKITHQVWSSVMLPKLLFFTVASTFLAYKLSYQLRFDFEPQGEVAESTVWIGLICLIAARLFSYLIFRAVKLTWRYFSLTEFVPLLKAHCSSTALFLASVLLLRLPEFPRSIAIIEFFLSLTINLGTVLSIRILFEKGFYPFVKKGADKSRATLVIGGGATAHLLVKTLLSHSASRYDPIAVLDDSTHLTGSLVHGVPVVGSISMLESILDRDSTVETVLLAVPSLSVERVQKIATTCRSRKLEFQQLRSFEDIAVHRLGTLANDIPVEAILKRDLSTSFDKEVVKSYRGKRVLVTGGAGSIGSEVIRQLALMEAGEVFVADNSEYFLFVLEQELNVKFPEINIRYILLDVCDEKHLELVFSTYQPEVVVHAAAYKHVPLSETNPYSVFRVNSIGTSLLVSLSIKHSVGMFILLSTDKAVSPSNVMGRTKRIAELLTQEKIRESNTQTRAAIVRFGNVINSRGSVIPLFIEQINSGGPITVTHRDVERYFMSIHEAVKLMLSAGTLGEKGEIFTLEMGDRIKILDVAKEMLLLAGREDVEIRFTGLRAGETLIEEVKSPSEELEETKIDKVKKIITAMTKQSNVNEIRQLVTTDFKESESTVEDHLRVLLR
jgi:FlaA1/EpsC-like NDP-sugar epimerase